MICKFKAMGLAVLTVLALNAVAASAVQASNFTASKYPTSATATSAAGNEIFELQHLSIECAGHLLMGPLSEPSPTVTVTATYTSCKALPTFTTATMNMNGCDYTFYTTGAVDLNCPAGAVVVITSGTCEATIGGQSGLKSVALGNTGTGIAAKAGIAGFGYSVTKDGIGCPFTGTGAKTGGGYKQLNGVTFAATNGATIDIG